MCLLREFPRDRTEQFRVLALERQPFASHFNDLVGVAGTLVAAHCRLVEHDTQFAIRKLGREVIRCFFRGGGVRQGDRRLVRLVFRLRLRLRGTLGRRGSGRRRALRGRLTLGGRLAGGLRKASRRKYQYSTDHRYLLHALSLELRLSRGEPKYFPNNATAEPPAARMAFVDHALPPLLLRAEPLRRLVPRDTDPVHFRAAPANQKSCPDRCATTQLPWVRAPPVARVENTRWPPRCLCSPWRSARG